MPALTASCPVIFLSSLSNTEEVVLFGDLGKKYVAKGTAGLKSLFWIDYMTLYQ